jgi:hypothetical protein
MIIYRLDFGGTVIGFLVTQENLLLFSKELRMAVDLATY